MLPAILLLALHPQPVPYTELAEVNHCHDSRGVLQFVQLLAWSWNHEYRRWECHDWVIVTDWVRTTSGVVGQGYNGGRIEVRCKYFRETWSNHDPERENQKLLPCGERVKVFFNKGK